MYHNHLHYPAIFDLLQMSKFFYACKNLRLSVLDSINGLGLFAQPLIRWSGGVKPPRSWKPFCAFGRLIVQYFAVFIRFSGDCLKHFKTWAILYWWWIRRRGAKISPRGARPPAPPPAGAGAGATSSGSPFFCILYRLSRSHRWTDRDA